MKSRVSCLRRRWPALAAIAALGLAACDTPWAQIGPLVRAAIASADARQHYPGLAKDVPYVAGGGDRQRLDIYPANRPGLAPTIVFFHGGYWQTGSRTLYAGLALTLAPLGFTTVAVDYRMYPEIRFPTFCDDAVDALNWIHEHIAQHGGDPRRLILFGHSAGAQIVAEVALADRFRRRLQFDWRDVRGVMAFAGPFDFVRDSLLDVPTLRRIMGSDENFLAAQPIRCVRADAPPMLIVNGDRDKLTSEAQAARFAQTMRDAGADVRYEKIAGGDHFSVLLDMVPTIKGPAYRCAAAFLQEKTRE